MAIMVVGFRNVRSSATVTTRGFLGMTRVGGHGAVLKLVSLEGLGLEAVRDKHAAAAACRGCGSGSSRPMLQASWCSMKLSTLYIPNKTERTVQ